MKSTVSNVNPLFDNNGELRGFYRINDNIKTRKNSGITVFNFVKLLLGAIFIFLMFFTTDRDGTLEINKIDDTLISQPQFIIDDLSINYDVSYYDYDYLNKFSKLELKPIVDFGIIQDVNKTFESQAPKFVQWILTPLTLSVKALAIIGSFVVNLISNLGTFIKFVKAW